MMLRIWISFVCLIFVLIFNFGCNSESPVKKRNGSENSKVENKISQKRKTSKPADHEVFEMPGCRASKCYKVKEVSDGPVIIINYEGTEKGVELSGLGTIISSFCINGCEDCISSKEFVSELIDKSVDDHRVCLENDVEKSEISGNPYAYAYVRTDKKHVCANKFVNAELIKSGLADIHTYFSDEAPNDKYKDYFEELEQNAEESQKGKAICVMGYSSIFGAVTWRIRTSLCCGVPVDWEEIEPPANIPKLE